MTLVNKWHLHILLCPLEKLNTILSPITLLKKYTHFQEA